MDEGLRADGIVVRFGGLVALNHVGIDAPPRRITGLIGPNGAGKTTMFNVCCGYLRPDEGQVFLDGTDVSHEAPPQRARRGLGRTFQRMELFRTLTVRENVELAAESLHIGDDPMTQLGLAGGGRRVRKAVRETADRLLVEVGLHELADVPAGAISTGQGRLVEVARALARDPKLLLLDEPSSGLDAAETAAFGELLRNVVETRGLGILLVEHDMNLVLSVCEWIHVLDFGRPLMAGSADDVRKSAQVRAAYLGQQGAA